jgi:hypothetical protein
MRKLVAGNLLDEQPAVANRERLIDPSHSSIYSPSLGTRTLAPLNRTDDAI